MSIETAEKFKRDLTDKFVVVADNVSELRRFVGLTGKVKTVNMSCRALVEFDGPVDIGWYDIDPSYLKVVDAPLPKQSKKEADPAAKTVEKKSTEKVTAKKPSGKKSPLQLAREQDAARAATAATTQEKPKKKLSPLEMARMQDVGNKKEAAAEAKTEQKPTEKPKPTGKKLSPLEMARRQDSKK